VAAPRVTGELSLPLRPGASGDALVDLQARLADLGLDTSGDEEGHYGPCTEEAVRAFQAKRGLRIDGVCGRATWSALVEAGYNLGDRTLYRRTPMLRGDDVAELQRLLSAIGFYPGAIDGIFGENTALALSEFQHNAGLATDGICGHRTLAYLRRLSAKSSPDLVSSVRERERLRGLPHTLVGTRVAVGQEGGFPAGAGAVCRALAAIGAAGLALHHPDPSTLASEANAAGVEVYIGLQLDGERAACSSAYYSGYRYESIASRTLAELLQAEVPRRTGLRDGGVQGMSIPILRETRMPAVLVELGQPALVVQRLPALAKAITDALGAWAARPWD
jgi:N-acetylmuramoyl-L-alanine amidase